MSKVKDIEICRIPHSC